MKIPVLKAKGMWNNVSGELFGAFVKNVFRQAEFCTRAKNYAGPYIGIRDIFQQMEASLMWIPDYVRGKIVEALNYIGENGRAPRQYSYVQNKNVLPSMDLRAFVDQGVWIISTVYKYLAYTGDYSILDEVCGYYKFDGKTAFCRILSGSRSTLFQILTKRQIACMHCMGIGTMRWTDWEKRKTRIVNTVRAFPLWLRYSSTKILAR